MEEAQSKLLTKCAAVLKADQLPVATKRNHRNQGLTETGVTVQSAGM